MGFISIQNIQQGPWFGTVSSNKNENDIQSNITLRTPNLRPSWKPFNETNPHKQWCPNATITCHNSPLCTPCNRRYAFVFATARSGSTTLLQTMNELPHVRMSGENDNAFKKAHNLYSD